ncbi:condensation domain-containing protein [Streptomyces sp. NPDC012616]|uniref:condensation domain-containing protein n=1 Tax=Streptomyces sp. NPDC012616 TaxID=3364840 RepID=UPI0036DFD4CD
MTERTDAAATDPVLESWTEVLGERGARAAAEGLAFIPAGGNSLRAARLVGLLERRCGVTVPLPLLLTGDGTVTALREHVRGATAAAPAAVAADDPLAAAAPTSPMALEQRRLWLLQRLHPHSGAYNVVAPLRLTGELDLASLQRALNNVVERYDVLRARVVTDTEGEPYWEYANSGALPLEVCRADDLSQDVLDAFVGRIAVEPIPDTRAPLARAVLLRSSRGEEGLLVLVLNHLIADHASLALIMERLGEQYSAVCAGEDPGPAEPEPSYAAYARRSVRRLGGAQHQRDLAHWRERLGHLPVESPMPFRRRRPEAPAFRGAAIGRCLGPEDSARLDRLLRDSALTPMAFFLACIGTVVAAWTGYEEVVLGVPVSRRSSPAEHRLAGFLLDTLPIVLSVPPETDLACLASHAAERCLEAVGHSTPTFDEIVADLGVVSRPGRNPFFQIWVNDLTESPPAPSFAGLQADAHPQPLNAALFDLGWYLWHRDGSYEIQLVRDIALFDHDVAEALADQALAVARQALADPQRQIGALTLSPHHLPAHPAPAIAAGPPEAENTTALVQRILRTAEQRPDEVALAGPLGALSYEQLAEAVRTTVARLADARVPPGATVEIAAERGVGLPIGLLGTWAHGACPVLVDTALPEERRLTARAATGPVAVLDTRAAPDGTVRAPSLCAPGIGDSSIDRSADGRLSHCLLTSGSTGGPLVVQVPHGPLAHFADWYVERFALNSEDRFGLLAGPGHDPVLRDIVTPLLVGASLHIPSVGTFKDPARLATWIDDNRITVAHVTPQLLELLVAASRPYRHLRLVVSAGSVLTVGLARRVHQLTDAVLVNAYGTTETPQIVACEIVAGPGIPPPAELPEEAPLPVGRGVAGHQVLVMTPRGCPAAPGQRGEIVVSGSRLAAGYAQAPAEAAARFRADPTGPPGTRWFFTGDLGRLDVQGRLVVDGRADRQLSVDGFRVEPAEVERAALAHPQVAQAVVGLRRTPAGEVLALQVTSASGGQAVPAAIRAELAARLPRYAVPAVIEVVDRMGRTANHKPASAPAPATSLPGPVAHAGDSGPAPDPSDPRLGAFVAGLAAEVLGRTIDPEERFMDAGMTSLTMVRFHDRLIRALSLDLPVTALFTHVTLRSLTRFIASCGQGADGGAVVAGPARRLDTGPVTSAAESRRALRRTIQEITGHGH